MARALMGHVGLTNDQVLVGEVARLRRRVRELEAELTQLRARGTQIDLELHQMTEDAAALA
ncbi:hypothetical protein [uncultured Jatrophihabitans sp.]|uniref:hypothetical protein n=1 Tax=uncultured Jatrophihabitans sp. TaxID=1610747 RepID=UPI0035CBBFB1